MSLSNPATVPTGQFEDATAALVVAPSGGDSGVCPRLLVGAADGGMDLLRVAYRDPGRVVEEWPTHLADPPENARLIAAGRAAAAVEASDVDHGVETVPPADLTELGVRTTELLDRWSATDRQSVVCLDSVTDLLGHVSFETAFRFLHVFTNQLGAVDAVGHVHVDPTAHDDRTVQRVMELFDAVVEHDEDGVAVRTRR